MSRRPTISILLPVSNAAATLVACLRSIRRQSAEDWECLVVDDGSTDDSPRIARSAATADPRFRPLRLDRSGLVATLNAGIDRCRGRWIARMDADDLMHRDRLRLQLAELDRHPGLTGAGCQVRCFPRAGLGPGMREYESWINHIAGPEDVRREAWVECPVAHPTLVLSREVLSRLRYRDRGWPEDYDLLLRLLRDGHRLGVVARRLHCWRRSPDNLSRVHPSYKLERFAACKAHHLARSFLSLSERYILWGYGRTGRTLAAALEQQGKHVAGIVEIHPGRIGNLIRDAPVFHFRELSRRVAGLPLVVSVARPGPRSEIRRTLAAGGWVELRDYVCAA